MCHTSAFVLSQYYEELLIEECIKDCSDDCGDDSGVICYVSPPTQPTPPSSQQQWQQPSSQPQISLVDGMQSLNMNSSAENRSNTRSHSSQQVCICCNDSVYSDTVKYGKKLIIDIILYVVESSSLTLALDSHVFEAVGPVRATRFIYFSGPLVSIQLITIVLYTSSFCLFIFRPFS